MRAPLVWMLEHVAGAELARDIEGDIAERGGGTWLLAMITMSMIVSRARHLVASLWRSLPGGRGRRGGLIADLRYAMRSLTRSPGYASTAIGVIALSMCLAITVFAVVDGVLFKPLPLRHPEQVFTIEYARASGTPQLFGGVISANDLQALRMAVPEAEIASFLSQGEEYIDDGDAVPVAKVDEHFFAVLGEDPFVGGFQDQDFENRTSVQPILISYALWQSRYGGDTSIVGRVQRVFAGGEFTRVVGILPASFVFPETDARRLPQAIRPRLRTLPGENSQGRSLYALIRVSSPRDVPFAQARMQTVVAANASRERAAKPESNPLDVVRLHPLDGGLRTAAQPMFRLVFAAACIVLLIACANVTGVATARARERGREMILRQALGAAATDIVRLIVVESAILVAAGGIIGLAAAAAMLTTLPRVLPPSLMLLRLPAVDGRVAVFAVIASAFCSVLVAISPTRRVLSATPSLAAQLSNRERRSPGLVLIAAQIALTFVMGSAGAVMAASLVRAWSEDSGFEVSGLVLVAMEGRSRFDADTAERLVDDVRRISGVASAGGSAKLPFDLFVIRNGFSVPGSNEHINNIETIGVTDGYFEAAGFRLLAGRWLTPSELRSSQRVVVVSATAAKRLWPGQIALDQTLIKSGQTYQVVGIVSDARFIRLDQEVTGNIYAPIASATLQTLASILVRTNGDAPAVANDIRSLLAAKYPAYRASNVEDLAGALSATIRGRQFHALLFSAFAVSGMVISGVGVFAIAAIVAANRRRELGVRLALGARPADIVGVVIRQELVAVAAGFIIGASLSFWIVRMMRAFMYKTSVYDPAMWALAAVTLFLVAATGALIPALRASRIDPIKALRVD